MSVNKLGKLAVIGFSTAIIAGCSTTATETDTSTVAEATDSSVQSEGAGASTDQSFGAGQEGSLTSVIVEDEAVAEEVIVDPLAGVETVFYFDFDKSNIRTDAATTLECLVDLMNKYPEMEVEVSAHTDARGKDQYNLELSKKRAASTLEYLVSKGIDRSRLKSIGYGEMQPLNKCDIEGIC